MTYSVLTLGCKVNQYESQAMETLLGERGLTPAAAGESADAVIVNTCAVTGEAGRKSRQTIRRARKENPDALIAVCGCFSQVETDAVAGLEVDIISGSSGRRDLVDTIIAELERRSAGERPALEIRRGALGTASERSPEFEKLPAGPAEGRTRAMLKIEDGCDNFCSYCVIPYARGRVRSMSVEDAAAEAARLAWEGYRELVITGIEIASYGKDLKNASLADVIEAIAAAAPASRLRLGSLEPTAVTEDFCARIASLGSVCPHFHLSLQSGCDRTLRAMNRKYGTARFFETTERLRSFFPNCGMTADLITGFPDETEADFAETLKFIEKCAFSAMHIFPYSERPGTRAAKMSGSVPKAERAARAHRAQAVADAMERSYLDGCVGRTLSVLFETEQGGVFSGHAGNYVSVSAAGSGLRGVVRNVKITGRDGQMLVGDLVD